MDTVFSDHRGHVMRGRLELDSIVVRARELPSAEVDDDLVLIDLATNNYLGLDSIGRRIWELIETPRRIDALCATLAETHSGAGDEIRADVIAFLGELHDEGLVLVTHDEPQ